MTREGIAISLWMLVSGCVGPAAPIERDKAESPVASEPALAAEELTARAEAVEPIERQSSEEQRAFHEAAALALRDALATQRNVLAAMREARTRAPAAERENVDREIAQHEERIGTRERELRELEARAQ